MESKKGANFIQKYEYQSEKFDVARLKVREQLTEKGKFDFTIAKLNTLNTHMKRGRCLSLGRNTITLFWSTT